MQDANATLYMSQMRFRQYILNYSRIRSSYLSIVNPVIEIWHLFKYKARDIAQKFFTTTCSDNV